MTYLPWLSSFCHSFTHSSALQLFPGHDKPSSARNNGVQDVTLRLTNLIISCKNKAGIWGEKKKGPMLQGNMHLIEKQAKKSLWTERLSLGVNLVLSEYKRSRFQGKRLKWAVLTPVCIKVAKFFLKYEALDSCAWADIPLNFYSNIIFKRLYGPQRVVSSLKCHFGPGGKGKKKSVMAISMVKINTEEIFLLYTQLQSRISMTCQTS